MPAVFYRLRLMIFGLVVASCLTSSVVAAPPVDNCASQSYPRCAVLFVGEVACQPCNGRCISERDLCILEPLPGGIDVIPASMTADLGAFFLYVNNGVWGWVFSVGVALAVLNGVAGGLMVVLSNGDSGKVEAGKARLFWSAMGLVLLLLSGVLLEFINPIGFKNV